MIKTKDQLIKRLKRLSEHCIDLGILFKELSKSLEWRKNEYTFKEMKDLIKESKAMNSFIIKELKGGLIDNGKRNKLFIRKL